MPITIQTSGSQQGKFSSAVKGIWGNTFFWQRFKFSTFGVIYVIFLSFFMGFLFISIGYMKVKDLFSSCFFKLYLGEGSKHIHLTWFGVIWKVIQLPFQLVQVFMNPLWFGKVLAKRLAGYHFVMGIIYFSVFNLIRKCSQPPFFLQCLSYRIIPWPFLYLQVTYLGPLTKKSFWFLIS